MTNKTLLKDEAADYTGQNSKKIDYFGHIREIGEIINQAGGMNDLFWEFAEPHLEILRHYLHIEKTTAALFAILLNLYNGRDIELSRIANFLKMKLIEVIQLMDEFEKLEQRELIIIHREDTRQPSYFSSSDEILTIKIPFRTIETMKNGICRDMPQNKNLSIDKFFIQLERLCENRVQGRESYENTKRKMTDLLQDNDHLYFVKKIQILSRKNTAGYK